jgi:hypothetical protein
MRLVDIADVLGRGAPIMHRHSDVLVDSAPPDVEPADDHTALPVEIDRPAAADRSAAGDRDSNIVQVVVYTHGKRSMGLVVGRIVDIVEHRTNVENASCGAGVCGTAVVHGRVTELVDVEGVIRGVEPAFFDEQELAETEAAAGV